MENLNEEIKKIKLLMVYDNSVTLSEQNHKILNEAHPLLLAFLKGGEELKLLKSEMTPFFNDFKSTGSFKGAKKIDDIFDIISAAKTSGKESQIVLDLSNVLKKQQGLSKDIVESLSYSLRDSEAFLTKYKTEILNGDMNALKEKMAASGKYSDDMISQVTKDLSTSKGKSLAKSKINGGLKDVSKETNVLSKEKGLLPGELSQYVKQSEVSKVAEQVGMTKEEINAWFKENTQIPKNPGYFKRIWTKIKNAGKIDKETRSALYKQGFLKWDKTRMMWRLSKKKVILWTLVIGGLTYWSLSAWLKKNGVFVDPKNEDENKIDNTNNGGGSGGGTGGGTNYTACTDFPYKKGCSSTIVAEVQKCLGLPDDGKFGPKTEAKLKELGYGTEITQDVYNKIKEKCGTSGTTTTTTLPAPEFQDLEVDPDSITI
jgi:hypothetical protein